MTWAPIGQKWLPKQSGAVESIEAGLEVCGAELERPMARHHLGERWLARGDDGSPWLAYRIDRLAGGRSARSFRLAAEILLPLRHDHLLPMLELDPDRAGGRWLLSPYVGTSAGVVTLADLMRQRETGTLKACEVVWVMQQVLSGVATAHEAGHCHGRFHADEILLERSGGVKVELYGLARRLRDLPAADPDARTDETRSVMELGFLLATGREWTSDHPGASNGRAGRDWVRSLGAGLGQWLEDGLVAGEFDTAGEARAGLDRATPARRIR
jgi:hypothetical protein